MYFCIDFDPQMGPKIKQNRKESAWYLLGTCFLEAKEGQEALQGRFWDPKTLLRGSQEVPRALRKAAKGSQDAPKGFQDAPQGLQKAPKTRPRHSKTGLLEFNCGFVDFKTRLLDLTAGFWGSRTSRLDS